MASRMVAFAGFDERDLRRTLNRALSTVGIGALAGLPLVWRAWGWRSLALYVVGAIISATGIFEWQRLMTAILARLQKSDIEGTRPPRTVGPVLFWFFLRLLAAGVVLYVSLERLGGRPIALILGLALAMIALLIEAVRLLHAWSA